MSYYSSYLKQRCKRKKKKKKKKLVIFTKANFIAFLLLIVIFFGAWYLLSHYFDEDNHFESPVSEESPADPITEFTHTYGELKEDTLAEIDRSEIDGIDQIEQRAKDYVISAGNIDYRSITGREGYEYITSELQAYLDETGDSVTKIETCEYHEMVRIAANPRIRKIINFPNEGFCYVEVYCDLTLLEANSTYNTDRWPDGIGSTIEGRWRLEFVKQSNAYLINGIDVLQAWDEERAAKYDKYTKLITTVE